MPYGTIKVDNVIYTKGGVDTTITVSGIVDSLSGAISVTGSISGASVSATTGTFTTLSGNTTAGTTATFVTGVFTTSLSGATITGNTGQFSNITGVSGVFTTRISGATITGNTGQFSSITGISGVFTSVSGTTFTVTSGVFASGTAAAPSVSVGTTTNGLYSSATNEVALATNSTSRLVVDASGNVNIDAGTFYVDAVGNRTGVNNTSPGSYNAAADDLVVGLTGDTGVTIASTNQGSIFFADGTTGGAQQAAGYLYYLHSNDSMGFGTVNTLRMTLDASGNLGLGVVPSAWNSSYKAIQFGSRGSISNTGGFVITGNNFYEDSSNVLRYLVNAQASYTAQVNGEHRWHTATSGTAGGAITFTQAMTLDASGRLGIGTTGPSTILEASQTTGTRIRSSYTNTSGGRDAGFEIYGDISGGFGVRSSLTYAGNSGVTSLTASLDLALSTGGSEQCRIDSSGRLLVGTSSARLYTSLGYAGFQVEGTAFANSSIGLTNNQATVDGSYLVFNKTRGTSVGSVTSVQAGDLLGSIWFEGADGISPIRGAVIEAVVDGTPGTNDMPGRLVFSTTADGAASPTERMRIGNGGATGLYCDDTNDTLYASSAAAAGTTRYLFIGKYSATGPITTGTNSILIFTNGNIQNTNNSYGAISDIKLKENIVDATSQWSDIKSLQVRKYNFKEGQTHTQIGLIAQEVELISPGLVSESPDRDAEGNDLGTVTKSVNYSVLYMKAVKALQEAMERIETLETKVAALESR